MNVREVKEHTLSDTDRAALLSLLQESFPEEPCFAQRIYYKQIPQRRLILELDNVIIGQVGLEHRVVGTQTGPLSILGVIDLCIFSNFQGHGHASQALDWIENQARLGGIDCVILFAQNPELYERAGYTHRNNTLRWTAIHEHKSLGITEEQVDELMIKEIGDRAWPRGTVDLLGYLF